MFPVTGDIGPLRFLLGPRSWVVYAKVRQVLFGSGNVRWMFRYFRQLRYNSFTLSGANSGVGKGRYRPTGL